MQIRHLAGVAAVEPFAIAIESVGGSGACDADQLESHRAGFPLQPILDSLAQRASPPRKRSNVFRPAAQSCEKTFLILPSSASACRHRSSETAFASPKSATI